MKKSELRQIVREEIKSLNEARTIGVKYKNMIKKTVAKVMKDSPYANQQEIEDKVRAKLPIEDMEDTWESAWSEIDRLINDTIMKTKYGR
jgi:hypothetical protein